MNDPQTYSPKRSLFAIGIIVGLTIFSALVHGVLDGRWSDAADLKVIGSRLDQLPEQFGSWELVENKELEEGTAALLRCHGSVMRIYRHSETGVVVNVAVLYGPRGPIAVHTPEICYDSVGTKQARPTRAESIRTTASQHRLWSVTFLQEPNPEPSLEVWYGWTVDGKWEAAEYPRFWLTENLYKIQLAGPAGNELQHPCRDFLEEFLPLLEKVVGPASTASTSDYSSSFISNRLSVRT
ncbi:MAG: exosortase-associated EpsI family protein [Planctomycetota bacterium]